MRKDWAKRYFVLDSQGQLYYYSDKVQSPVSCWLPALQACLPYCAICNGRLAFRCPSPGVHPGFCLAALLCQCTAEQLHGAASHSHAVWQSPSCCIIIFRNHDASDRRS